MAFNVQPFSEARKENLWQFSIVPVANGTGGQDGKGIKGHNLSPSHEIQVKMIQLPQAASVFSWKIYIYTRVSVAGSDRNDRDRKLVDFTYLRDL